MLFPPPPRGVQILASVFLYLGAIIVGITSYYMADRKHRKAFLEARQSLEVKMNLEEQSQQQVRLFGGGPGFRSQVRKERAQCSSTAHPGRTGFGLLKARSRSSSLCLVNVRLPLFLPTSPRLPSLPAPFIWPVIENFAS